MGAYTRIKDWGRHYRPLPADPFACRFDGFEEGFLNSLDDQSMDFAGVLFDVYNNKVIWLPAVL